MSLLTSFRLSIQNLISKKARTFLTSFAGSIGIIGIALVLSVSNGFSIFMNDLQEMSMGNSPIYIYSSMLNSQALSFDQIDRFLNGGGSGGSGGSGGGGGGGGGTQQTIYETKIKGLTGTAWADAGAAVSRMQHRNLFSQDYLDYLKENVEPLSNYIVYNYGIALNLFTRSALSGTGDVVKLEIPSYSLHEMMATMDMSKYQQYVDSFGAMYTSINWERLLEESDFLENNFTLLAGEDYPQNYTDIALLVDSSNKVDSVVLAALGFTDAQIKSGISVEEVLGKTFKVIPNEVYYDYSMNTLENGLKLLNLAPKTSLQYEGMYTSEEEGIITLTVSSIIRQKSSSATVSYDTGVLYTPMLTEKVLQEAQEREGGIVSLLQQSDAVCIINPSTGFTRLAAVKESKNRTKFTPYFFDKQINEDWITIEKTLGASEMPTSIEIYAKDFDAKTKILYLLKDYNKDETGEEKAVTDQILFSDATGLITSYMGVLIDGVSYTLITFAAISLVVSSIMIGIITYVSVVERTREIGVLRALGASKKEVGWVFIAETFIIGLAAGVLGIGASYLLSGVINLIMTSFAPALSHIALLNPLHAFILIAVSFALTVIAGIIPSRIASKKDPVVALRTE